MLGGGCHKHRDDAAPAAVEPVKVSSPTLYLFKVDYLTQQFEGGKILTFPAGTGVEDSIPLTVVYRSPGDFGGVTFLYTPTSDTVFDGTIIWMGKGEVNLPHFDAAASFALGGTPAAAPDSAAIQHLRASTYERRFADTTIARAWSGIAPLLTTQQLSIAGARKGLFLYTPSVGMGDPADWDFIWMLYLLPAL